MPIHIGHDKIGKYLQWGDHGHKYYFDPHSRISFLAAHRRATKQARAAYANGYRER